MFNPPLTHTLAFYSFNQLMNHLRDKNVIRATQRCFCRVHCLAVFSRLSPRVVTVERVVNIRVIMAAYMIVYHPDSVFEQIRELETDLSEAAANMLRGFNAIIELLCEHGNFALVPAALVAPFPADVVDFLDAFDAWKTPDMAKLLNRVKAAMLAICIEWRQTPVYSPDYMDLMAQYVRLRTKLLQYGGAQALEEFHEMLRTEDVPVIPDETLASV